MNIKKMDDKPKVIHAKEKTKLHSHAQKKTEVKGSNVLTVNRSPKIQGAMVSGTLNRNSNTARYRKGTIHIVEKAKLEETVNSNRIRKRKNSSLRHRILVLS